MFGLYKGFVAMNVREVPSWAVYFWTYEYFKEKLQLNQIEDTDLTWRNLSSKMFAGGMAGFNAWLSCYPMDTIKT